MIIQVCHAHPVINQMLCKFIITQYISILDNFFKEVIYRPTYANQLVGQINSSNVICLVIVMFCVRNYVYVQENLLRTSCGRCTREICFLYFLLNLHITKLSARPGLLVHPFPSFSRTNRWWPLLFMVTQESHVCCQTSTHLMKSNERIT